MRAFMRGKYCVKILIFCPPFYALTLISVKKKTTTKKLYYYSTIWIDWTMQVHHHCKECRPVVVYWWRSSKVKDWVMPKIHTALLKWTNHSRKIKLEHVKAQIHIGMNIFCCKYFNSFYCKDRRVIMRKINYWNADGYFFGIYKLKRTIATIGRNSVWSVWS